MEKVVLDWKAPSERKMADLVGTLSDKEKKEFVSKFCVVRDGKNALDKNKAKKWVKEKFEGNENVEWKNLPKGTKKRPSVSDILEEWKNL